MPQTTPPGDTPEVTLFLAFLVLLLIIFGSLTWVIFGALVVGLTSVYAGFLFVWYWGVVEQAKFERLLPALAGAITGIALAWQLYYLATHFGTTGLVAGLVVIFAAQYLELLQWIPGILNKATFLFLIVLTTPLLIKATYFPKMFVAVGLGAAYSALLAYAAVHIGPYLLKPPRTLAREAGK